jgi:hypothetical protein
MQDLIHSQKIKIFSNTSWQPSIINETQQEAAQAFEQGKILFFPELHLSLSPKKLNILIHAQVAPKSKNISYNFKTNTLKGSQNDATIEVQLKSIMRHYAQCTQNLLTSFFPHYANQLLMGRTSLRPVEIAGRPTPSYRKDDTRLHVDAFPANPVQGYRILRVFYNYNLENKPRIWRVGEEFSVVAQRFLTQIPKPIAGSAWLLKILKITHSQRTPYDHYMLQLHNRMKHDMDYQQTVVAETLKFPAQSTWMVYTDQVSHAALSGQHVLEQTFYLPIAAMYHPEYSPLKILERLTHKTLA